MPTSAKKTTKSKVGVETKEDAIATSTQETAQETVQETVQEVATPSPIVSYASKKKIPMDAIVMVKNCTGGKLYYVSKRLQGYEEMWSEFGEELPMEMAELYSMKNTDRRFFTDNWIQLDAVVLRDLNMDKFYEKFIPIEKIDEIFTYPIDKMIAVINDLKPSIKNAFALEAIRRVESQELTNFQTITAIEKTLNCELYEH